MVVHTCDLNTQEVKAGEVQGLSEVTSDPSALLKKKKKKIKPGSAFLCGSGSGL